jgi:malonate-semialdehyde dehydrogenase (acetylating)/methylmalonate-semialdehyde dehydrogenase
MTFKGDFLDVISPLNGEIISQVPLGSSDILDDAVNSAKTALLKWSTIPIKERVQVFYRYKYLLEKNLNELSVLIREENGKTILEAKAEVEKSIELTEFACSLPQLVQGELLEVSKGVECRSERYPVGVVASITPFNFPFMVPNWSMPNALTLGNAMILPATIREH